MIISGKIKIPNSQDEPLKYLDGFLDLVRDIKSNPEYHGKLAWMSIDIQEKTIRDSQRKYYWGYLIPPIADKSFDGDNNKAHIEMKYKFLYERANDINDIPKNKKSRSIFVYNIYRKSDGEFIATVRHAYYDGYQDPSLGDDFIIKLDGYIPSLSKLSKREASLFLLKVESFALNDLQVSIKNDLASVRNDAIHVKEDK